MGKLYLRMPSRAGKCTCDRVDCFSRQPIDVQKRARAYINAFRRSKTKLLKRTIPSELLSYCCINCRFAGNHVCKKACFVGVFSNPEAYFED